jgi:hypothetical protein
MQLLLGKVSHLSPDFALEVTRGSAVVIRPIYWDIVVKLTPFTG